MNMKMVINDYKVDKAHARIFARAIYKDIAAYMESHQEAYEEFKEVEENENQSSHGQRGVHGKTVRHGCD